MLLGEDSWICRDQHSEFAAECTRWLFSWHDNTIISVQGGSRLILEYQYNTIIIIIPSSHPSWIWKDQHFRLSSSTNITIIKNVASKLKVGLGILKITHWQVLWQLELSKNIICIQCSVLSAPPVHQHGYHLDTDFQDRDQASDGSRRKPPHLRRPGRVLQQCCQQDAQQLMCNRENEINQTKRYKCHQHTGQAEFLRKLNYRSSILRYWSRCWP